MLKSINLSNLSYRHLKKLEQKLLRADFCKDAIFRKPMKATINIFSSVYNGLECVNWISIVFIIEIKTDFVFGLNKKMNNEKQRKLIKLRFCFGILNMTVWQSGHKLDHFRLGPLINFNQLLFIHSFKYKV